jgi:hypothetical protein
MRRGSIWALLVAALTVIMAVTPGVASAAPSVPAGLTVDGMAVPATGTASPITTFTLTPQGEGLVAAPLVTCTVFDSGPYGINGFTIGFTVDTICDGTVDFLSTDMAMGQYATAGGYVGVPGSYRHCELLATDYLPCASTGPCSLAAEFYFGFATVRAALGTDYKELSLITSNRVIPCAV